MIARLTKGFRLRAIAWLLPLLPLLALTACRSGEDRLAGGGGVDVEGITVEGKAMRADNTPVAGARVRLRAWDYQKSVAAPKVSIDGGDTRTDSSGRFRFKDVDMGRYAVEVDAGEDGATVLEIDADGSQRVLIVEAFVQPQGSITGMVQDGGGTAIAGATVGILGLDRETRTDSGGAFILAGLPPGLYTLRVQPDSPAWSAIELPLVEVRGGAGTDLGPVVLPASVPGLLAYWRFDEGKGSLAADAQGSLARATLHGHAGWSMARDSFGLSLPADSGYVFVPKTKSASLDIDSGADFTLTVWMKSASPGAGAGAVRYFANARTDYAPNGYSLGLAADGGCEFLSQSIGSSATLRISGGSGLDDGAWHQVAAGRSGDRYFLYADGALLGESTGPTQAMTKDNPLYFGSREGKSGFFAGLLDDVRIYSRGLTAEEAKALAAPAAP